MLLRALALTLALAPAAGAETIRIATYSAELTRNGPGLLLRDLDRDDAQINAVIDVITHADADILLLTGFDWDLGNEALTRFRQKLDERNAGYAHAFSDRPNSGVQSGLDLDGDGRFGTPDDAQGYGRFTGSRGMALLSRLPFEVTADLTLMLWQDLPDHQMPEATAEVMSTQRLSSTAHWQIEVATKGGPLQLLTLSATPPVFDGPEDRNGRRNHDELALWLDRLPATPWILMGKINLDPVIGEGRRNALEKLMQLVDDPAPSDAAGDMTTADWGPDRQGRPRRQRVDYILPSKELRVTDAGVISPIRPDLEAAVVTASRHYLVWVDLKLPAGPAPQ